MHSHIHPFRNALHGIGQDYNFRPPAYLNRIFMIGLIGTVFAVGLHLILPNTNQLPMVVLGVSLLHALPVALFWLILRLLNSYRLRMRDRMAHLIDWRGDEQVLDVGTGNGISLIGCAQHLTTGKAVGIDIWDPNAGGGTPEIFWNNVRNAGVEPQVELQNVDVRTMPFDEARFDVIVSSFAMHHVGHSGADREQAAREMMRVLKPGGKIAILDVKAVMEPVEQALRANGFRNVAKTGRIISLLTAQKA